MYSFQWTLTDLACEMFSMVTVPVYDTHGPRDCIYIINHGRGRRISPSILISRHLSPSVTIYEYARLLSVTTLNSVSLSQAPRHLCAMMVIISTKNPPLRSFHTFYFSCHSHESLLSWNLEQASLPHRLTLTPVSDVYGYVSLFLVCVAGAKRTRRITRNVFRICLQTDWHWKLLF